MTDFSRDPDRELADNVAAGYVGLRIQQGVPILDRDLNLLSDLVAASVRTVVARYLGSGVALRPGSGPPQRSDAFRVVPVTDADNDFTVSAGTPAPGRCLVNGIELTIPADVRYTAQGLAGLAPPDSGTRTDVVYLDAFLATDETGELMENPDDVVVQTSVRLRPAWLARVAVGGTVPDPEPGHGHLPLARIARDATKPKITADALTDLRTHCFALPDVQRVLLDPVVFGVSRNAQVGKESTITGRNFLFFPGEKVTVGFGDAAPVAVAPDKLTPTSIAVTVPSLPLDDGAADVPITVRTAHGSAQITVRILPA